MPAIRGEAFWETLESRLHITIPIHLKYVCESQGIDHRLNFIEVTETEFIAYEEFVRHEDYAASIHNEANTAVYYNNHLPEDFRWSIDDLAMFKRIKKFLTESDPQLWIKTTPVPTPASNWKQSTLLTMLTRSEKQNRTEPSNKHTFTQALKYVCAYIRMLAGSLLYGFLAANLPIPSLTTIGEFIGLTCAPITEGLLRINDLKNFLSERKYPCRIWLSEDATSISNRVEYDPKSNQVVGHILPLNANGMPKTYSFIAKSAAAIENCFTNHRKSSLLNVFMAQANDKNAAPFCLMAYGTDGKSNYQEVLRRWSYIIQSIEQHEIEVLGLSSDGDLRLMKAMRIKMQLPTVEDVNHKYYIQGFKAKYLPKNVFIQDAAHKINKLRVKLCDSTDVHTMGSYSATSGDLRLLVQRETKDYHRLQELDLTGKDKMSFGASARVCHPRIWHLLKEHVPGSDGTQVYLKVMFFAMQAMLSTNLNSLERIYCLWYSLFFLRIWHAWLIENGYKISETFITKNAYECMELNGHGLLNLVFKSMEEEGSLELFPWLYSSQACEGFFRNLRSLCSTFATVVNVSVLGALRRIKQIQLLSDITAYLFEKLEHKIIFPRTRFLNASNEKQEETFEEIPRFPLPLTIESIRHVMSQAKADARETAEALGMKGAENAEYEVHLKSPDADDYTEIVEDEPDIQTPAGAEAEAEEDDVNRPSAAELKILQNNRKPLNLPDFSSDQNNLTPDSPIVVVVDSSGNRKVVKKGSLCWFLDNRQKLSSDRLLRVKQGENKPTFSSRSQERVGIQEMDEIHTNDFCVFQTENTSDIKGNCVIGLVSGFGYTIKGRKSERAYTRDYATIHPEKKKKGEDKKEVGVLARWFSVDPLDRKLSINTKFSQGLILIGQYRLTIPYPKSNNGHFYLSNEVYQEITELLDNDH